MFEAQQIEALTHGCMKCTKPLKHKHFVSSCYSAESIRTFNTCLDVGIFGEDVRNFWAHVDCAEPDLKSWHMKPIITQCIRCKRTFSKQEFVQPVFGVIDGNKVNPTDPTDRGVELSDRIYFVHVDCKNRPMKSSIIL